MLEQSGGGHEMGDKEENKKAQEYIAYVDTWLGANLAKIRQNSCWTGSPCTKQPRKALALLSHTAHGRVGRLLRFSPDEAHSKNHRSSTCTSPFTLLPAINTCFVKESARKYTRAHTHKMKHYVCRSARACAPSCVFYFCIGIALKREQCSFYMVLL